MWRKATSHIFIIFYYYTVVSQKNSKACTARTVGYLCLVELGDANVRVACPILLDRDGKRRLVHPNGFLAFACEAIIIIIINVINLTTISNIILDNVINLTTISNIILDNVINLTTISNILPCLYGITHLMTETTSYKPYAQGCDLSLTYSNGPYAQGCDLS